MAQIKTSPQDIYFPIYRLIDIYENENHWFEVLVSSARNIRHRYRQKTVKRNKVNNNANKILWNFIIFFIIRRAYETEKSRPNLIWPHLHAP